MTSKFPYFLILLNLLAINGEDTQANCEIDTSNTGAVEYVCPPSPYSTKTSIHVYSKLLIIDCNNTEVLDDTVLPRGNHNNIFKLVLKKCPLPAKGFKDLVNRFNITSLKELTFTLGTAANYTIEANELTGLEELDSLDLSESNILTLNGEIFKNTPNLSILKMNRNEIKLNENLFDNLQNLTNIAMFSNGIRTIPNNTFKKLTKLKTLELWNNKIGDLKRGMFDGLKELKLLELSKNRIQFIENDTFKDLTSLAYLNLAKNVIPELTRKVFENCRNIEIIWLKYNGLMFLRDDVFSQFHKLEVVYLSDNNLMELQKMYSRVRKTYVKYICLIIL
ncbi:hypothetical protein WA026_011593 [Henosepilachna vigintioctopunctata]|uniref:Uncharacterized protein n=1 Tax=Henosepilachna vigintioctopunctata TaxID=420089 RepID=A0AAW1TT40_9CUCU